jgi:hypothetical protein
MSQDSPTDSNRLVKKEGSRRLLDAVGERVVESEDLREIVIWTQVRGEIVRQNDESKGQEQQRRLEIIQLCGKLLLSLVAIGIGVLLLKWNYTVAGLFSLGVGFFWLAPDLVKAVFGQFKPRV